MSGKQTLRGHAVISTTGKNKNLRMCSEIRLIISRASGR